MGGHSGICFVHAMHETTHEQLPVTFSVLCTPCIEGIDTADISCGVPVTQC